MQTFTSTTSTAAVRAGLRTWVAAAMVLFGGASASAATAAPAYSNTGQVSHYDPYASVLGAETGAQFPERAADASLTNYTTLNVALGVASSTGIRLGLSGTGGHAGDRAGVLVSNVNTNRNLLNFNALGTITLRTYGNGNNVLETRVVSADVARAILAAGERPTQVEFVAGQDFSRISLTVSGLAGVSYKLRVYYAYALPSLVQQQARGVLSQFTGTGSTLDSHYAAGVSPTGIVSACAGVGIVNPERAVDNDLSNYAQFASLATVSCPSSLSVDLAGGTAPGGYYAGFVIGNDGLLDLSVLSGLRVTTYRNGQPTGESATGAGLLELRALPDGKYQVSFPTTLPFDEVKIERVGAVSALDNLKLYYGFGVEPRAFEGSTEVLSDFDASQTSGKYEVRQNSLLCASLNGSCGVTNPQGAADNDPTTFATVNMPVAALSTVELKLNLNGTGAAGNRAGMVVGDGTNLLDAAALDRLTISTYDAAGNLLESAAGSSLLSLNLLPDGRQEVSFLTTQAFASVQLTAASGVSVLNSFPVHYAFADDRTGGLPSLIVPLPVELTAFGVKWANGGADVAWTTASEKNSSYFVVERSTGADAPFVAVGRVSAAGNSSRVISYKLRDAEAGTLGAELLYYRLRQVDADGTITLSPVVSLAVGKLAAAAPRLELYPNPASEAQPALVRCLNLPATGGRVQAYSELGQLVSELAVPAATADLPLKGLQPGLYHVVLRDADGRALATQRLVVGSR